MDKDVFFQQMEDKGYYQVLYQDGLAQIVDEYDISEIVPEYSNLANAIHEGSRGEDTYARRNYPRVD
ncbi:MAG: hypothetical protein Q9M91_03420 [Candidatus Dojkabacteria bacterium]|nr:hypothetical protein [Candidatus Dojkabacteria bacterium]MDQ7020873.1 hypothetical protein [Candidatus Dojkabacteria bacterium]